ncbi:MAG: DUF3261 domain-containing protein [Francisellaceae bacterium]
MILRYLIIFTLALFLSGCALFQTTSTQTPSIELFNQDIQLPLPQALDLNLTATQILEAKYNLKGKASYYSTQVEIEASRQKLVMVALAGWGGSLFSLQYDGKTIYSSSLPMPHANMGVRQSLADFILTYAPVKTLRQMLINTDLSIEILPHQRLIKQKGKTLMTISYENTDPWKGKVTLENQYYHYQIIINTLKREHSNPDGKLV